MGITPLYDHVLVKRVEAEEKTAGGIFIPGTAQEKQQIGEIIAVGCGRQKKDKLIPLNVKVGDKIVFGKYAGTEVKIDGQEHSIMKESEILAILTEE